MSCSDFYAKTNDTGKFENNGCIGASHVLVVSNKIANNGYIQEEVDSDWRKTGNDKANINSDKYMLNTGAINCEHIEVKGLPFFSTGSINCKEVIINGVKYSSKDSSKQQIPNDLVQKIDSLNATYKISPDTLNAIKQGWYESPTKNIFNLLPLDYSWSISIDSQKQQEISENTKKSWSNIEKQGDCYEIVNQNLIKVAMDLNKANKKSDDKYPNIYSTHTLVVHSQNKDLYDNTTLLASMPGGDINDKFILSPNVNVIRGDDQLIDNPFNISVLTIPTVVYKDSDKSADIKNDIKKRIRDIILLAAYYGYEDLALDVSCLNCDMLDPFFIAQCFYNVLNGYCPLNSVSR